MIIRRSFFGVIIDTWWHIVCIINDGARDLLGNIMFRQFFFCLTSSLVDTGFFLFFARR
jgi:hypothetical protein